MQKIHGHDIWFDHFRLEFEAHIRWFCSTDEYSFGAEYELQTPSGSGRTRCHVPIFSAAELAIFTTTIKKHTTYTIAYHNNNNNNKNNNKLQQIVVYNVNANDNDPLYC